MAGRKSIFNREEQRENQIAVPMSEYEKNRIKEAANNAPTSDFAALDDDLLSDLPFGI